MSRVDEARYGKACLLVLNVCPFTLRHVIDKYRRQHGSLSLFDFLQKNKHTLFHLYSKRCCCRSQSSRATPMYKSQWESLFMKNTSTCHRGVNDCPCKYDAKPGITTLVMDITMCCLIINNICPAVNVTDVNTIREIRNKLVHASSGHLDQLTFSDYWTKVKTALLNLASHVLPSVHTDTLSMIDELDNRVMNTDELGELKKLIIDEKRFKDLEEDVLDITDNLEQTREEMMRIKQKVAGNLEQTKEEMTRVKETVTDRLEQTKEEMKRVKEKVTDRLEQTKEEMTRVKETMTDSLEQTREEMTRVKEKVTDNLEQTREEMTRTTQKVADVEKKLTKNVRQTQKEMSRLESTFGSKSDIKQLKEKLAEINNDTTKVIPLSPLQERGKAELPIELLYASVVIRKDLNYAEKGHSDSVHVPPRTRSKLDVIKTFFKRLPDRMSSGEVHDVESEDIREVTDPSDIFPKRGKEAIDVYMLGDAAHGKTTYCLWLLKKWCNAQVEKMRLDKWDKAIKKFDFVFLLQLRHVNPGRASVVDMICQDVFRRYKGCHATIRHVLSSDKYRSLIIMDGLDEWNPNEETRTQLTCQRMPNIEDVSSTVSCFFSMRPWVFPTISKHIKVRDKVMEIQGLSETGMMNVIQNVLINHYKLEEKSSNYTDTYEKIAKQLNQTSLKSFMQIPLLAVVCVQIWYEGKQVGDSLTSFYAEMLNMIIERGSQRHEIHIDQNETVECKLPESLSKYMEIRQCSSILLKLGKVAYEGLLSNETHLVFQTIELEKEIGGEELQFALDVGLISQKETASLTRKNVSVHFFHKSIQEFLAVIYIVTNKEVSESFCKHLSNVKVIMELSNVIMFICGMCPCLGSVISQRVVSVTDNDTEICQHRDSPEKGDSMTMYGHSVRYPNHLIDSYSEICGYTEPRGFSPITMEELYKLQVGWYRELQYGLTDSQMTCYVSDVCLWIRSDKRTVSVTRKLLSDPQVDIRSLNLDWVYTDGEFGITNTQLNDFLRNKYNNTKSLVKVCIKGGYTSWTLHTICIPTLNYLCLWHVKINNTNPDGNVCPLLTDMKTLRVLQLEWVTLSDRGLEMSDMTSLQELQLSNMILNHRGLCLSNMTSLRVLQLNWVTLGDKRLRLFDMTALQELQLSNMFLDAEGLDLSPLTSLRVLKLTHVSLGDRGLDLSNMTSLHELRLKNITLSKRGLDMYASMVHIKEVIFWHVDMSAAQWQQFILSVLNIEHEFQVELRDTNIDYESKTMIKSSPHFRLTLDLFCSMSIRNMFDLLNLDKDLLFIRVWPLTDVTH